MPAKQSLTNIDNTKNIEIAKTVEAKILKAKILLNNMYALLQNFWKIFGL